MHYNNQEIIGHQKIYKIKKLKWLMIIQMTMKSQNLKRCQQNMVCQWKH
jgi:hypothetical protein